MIHYATTDPYQAGACNIGPAEIGRRRRSAILLTVVAAVAAAAILVADVPPLGRLVFLPFAAGAAINWLQVVRRFCVGFAAAGLQNFGELGAQQRVADDAARAADRRRAARMTLEGVLYGAIATAVLVALPV